MNKKRIIVLALSLLIPLMAVGYAILNQTLVISGTSHVDSNWQIEIINITESDIVGDATDKVAPSYTATTARFKVSLINPTDSITYNIKIKNLGTLDARIKKITVDIGESDAIIYDVNLVKNDGTIVNLALNNEINQTNIKNTKNTTLSPAEEQTIKLKVTFKEGYIGQPDENNSSNTIKMTIDYVQNFVDSNGQQINNYDEYKIGDKITFAGSNWYVIEDSDSSRDYVTLLKENVLTASELTTYYAWNGLHSYTPYYWSETCRMTGTFGGVTYSSSDESGCAGHNDYAGSKVKEMLETVYLPAIDSQNNKLKEVNEYKIRLITIEELQNNLGLATERTGNQYLFDRNLAPSWIVLNDAYWTMTPNWDSKQVQIVSSNYALARVVIDRPGYYVRPVINLLKSAIE